MTLSPRPGDRLIEAVDSPLDLRALDGGVLIAYQAAFAVIIIAFVGAAGSLVGRFRRARGVERQQLRWVALATVLIAMLAVVNLATLALGAYALAPLVGGLNPPILSAGIGAAILRYRLYDLDRITAAPSPMGCSPWSWAAATPRSPWSSASCWAATPAWPWPGPPWPWRRCSSPPAAASKRR